MVVELDIAGEFIYNGIQEINRLSLFNTDGPTFIALYNVSVGIERLQKIVLVLWGLDEEESGETFEKDLITHSHTGLRDRIAEALKKFGKEVKFSEQENALFLLLNHFYNSARYERYNLYGVSDKEIGYIEEFVNKFVTVDAESPLCLKDYIRVSDEVKTLFGRTIGKIARKYYELVKEGSQKNNTYTYELRSGSKAEKVFVGELYKNSLILEQKNEAIALKELLIFLRRANCKNAFLKYIDEIEPLDFDPEMLVYYFKDVINGIVPQELVDEVEYLYGEMEYGKDRMIQVEMFANPDVDFEFPHVVECMDILKKVSMEEDVSETDIEKLQESIEYIGDDDMYELINRAFNNIKKYKEHKLSKEELKEVLNGVIAEYGNFFKWEDNEEDTSLT